MYRVCLLVIGTISNWNTVYAADLYVEFSGSCGGETPCYSTIQEAINAVNSGDTVKLAQGIYAETFVLNSNKQLMIQGGWDTAFTTQTPRTTAIRAPMVTKGAIAFQELRIMEIAGPTGNATTADVLNGKTFSSDAGTGLAGVMPNRGAMNYTPTTADQTIAVGYYNGSGKVEGDSNLIPGNIRSGVAIFGVAGDTNVVNTSSGDAAAGDMLSGKKAWVAGGEVTGNATAGASVEGADGSAVVGIPDGLYFGSKTATAYDSDLVEGNIKDGVTVFGVTGTFPSDGTAVAGDVKSGSTFYTTSGSKLTGNGTKVLSAANDAVAEGYYAATTLSGVDTDLKAANIKKDVTIFGVTGRLVDGGGATRVPKTGQTQCWNASGGLISCGGTGQDGEYQRGVLPPVAPDESYLAYGWAGIRFTDNLDAGTVTDNLTGLIWLRNAKCWDKGDWQTGLTNCNNLASGSCGLADGSVAGDWRLPNINELQSLLDTTQSSPALPAGHPFQNVQSHYYWSSTTSASNRGLAWHVDMGFGFTHDIPKEGEGVDLYAWPVRSGN